VATVVTRYFGGILLGAGGLVRAYSRGAKEAVMAAGIVRMCLCYKLSVQMEYSFYDKMLNLLQQFGAVVLDTRYTDRVMMMFSLEQKKTDACLKAIKDAANARIAINIIGQTFAPAAISEE
jgi:putative IMPACT (imprinted ancient) family translation regulator